MGLLLLAVVAVIVARWVHNRSDLAPSHLVPFSQPVHIPIFPIGLAGRRGAPVGSMGWVLCVRFARTRSDPRAETVATRNQINYRSRASHLGVTSDRGRLCACESAGCPTCPLFEGRGRPTRMIWPMRRGRDLPPRAQTNPRFSCLSIVCDGCAWHSSALRAGAAPPRGSLDVDGVMLSCRFNRTPKYAC